MSKTPITDAYRKGISGGTGHVDRGWIKTCRKLELRNAKLSKALIRIAAHDRDWNAMWAGQVAREALQS
jgi:hypothetical protein